MGCIFHKWNGCVCAKCGKTRHIWTESEAKDFQICRQCGAIRYKNADHEEDLLFKVKDGVSPQGRPRVYFCCHRNDFTKYFSSVTDEVLGVRKNAAVWFRNPAKPFPAKDRFLSDLKQMQLFVIPVTSDFLYTDDPARTVELVFALENHIPVLPLMQEAGLDREFNRICGDIQFLDKNAASGDPTALPYEAKLKSFLEAVLVGDELAERIRDAFDAYIFLSYRKKDRAEAQKIMRLIHSSEFCRDLAIWYDEFLTPGENFNEEIEAALEKSRLFAMVVTPSLLEDPNYVQTTEYPAAKAMGKERIPIEAVDTDAEQLAKMYEGIGECFSANDPERIAVRLKELMDNFGGNEKRGDPAHEFLIGLAYLAGVDVEIDHERAVRLITMAADAEFSDAYEKLVSMYQTGEGVERNWQTALDWQTKYADLLDKQAQSAPSASAYERLFAALWKLADYQAEMDDETSSHKTIDRMLSCAEEELRRGSPQAGHDLYIAYNRQGSKAAAQGDRAASKKWFMKGLEYSKAAAEETGSEKDRHNLVMSYENLGTVCYRMGEFDEAREWLEKDLEISRVLAEETGRPLFKRDLGIAYERLGDICVEENKAEEARDWYEKEQAVMESAADGSGKPLYRRILAGLYRKLGGVIGAQGDFSVSLELYEKSFAIYSALTEEDWSPSDRFDMCMACAYVGNLYEYFGDLPKAIAKYEEALNLAESVKDEFDRKDFAELYETLAALCMSERKWDKQWEWQKKAFEIRAALAEENPDSLEDKIGLSAACMRLGKSALNTYDHYKEGDGLIETGYKLALELAEEAPESEEAQHNLFTAYERYGDRCNSNHDYEKARMCYEKVAAYMLSHSSEKIEPDGGMRLAWVYGVLGNIYKNLKDYDTAIDYDEKKLAIYLKNKNQEKIHDARRFMVWTYRAAGEEAKEKGDLRKARDIYIRGMELSRANEDRNPFFHCLDRLIKIHEEMDKRKDYSAEERRRTLEVIADNCRYVMKKEPDFLYYRDYAKSAEKELNKY